MRTKPSHCPCCGSNDLEVGVMASCTYGVKCLDCLLTLSVEVSWDNPKGLKLKELEKQALKEAIRRWNRRST